MDVFWGTPKVAAYVGILIHVLSFALWLIPVRTIRYSHLVLSGKQDQFVKKLFSWSLLQTVFPLVFYLSIGIIFTLSMQSGRALVPEIVNRLLAEGKVHPSQADMFVANLQARFEILGLLGVFIIGILGFVFFCWPGLRGRSPISRKIEEIKCIRGTEGVEYFFECCPLAAKLGPTRVSSRWDHLWIIYGPFIAFFVTLILLLAIND